MPRRKADQTRAFRHYPILSRSSRPVATVCLYAAPLLVTCLLMHLAYFPGQMSPDSVDQFIQLSTGQFRDAQPLPSTLLFKVFYTLYPHPAAIVLCNYVLLTLTMGVLLWQLEAVGIPRWLLLVTSLLMAAFPPNFLIATTMWKDAPYTSGAVLATAGIVGLLGNGMKVSALSAWLLMLGCGLVIGMRHNGIMLVVPLLLLLLLTTRRRSRAIVSLLLIGQIALFATWKTVLVSALGAVPVDRAYSTIFALPPLAAMASADQIPSPEAEALLSRAMPIPRWKEAYDCSTVVPLFWHKELNQTVLGEHAARFNLLALEWIVSHPASAVKHQLCMTSIIWNPFPSGSQWIAISPREVTQFHASEALGLKTDSRLPALRAWLDTVVSPAWEQSSFLNRPATYMWLACALCLMAAARVGAHWMLLAAPAGLNAASLLPVIGSQDYRYMWPTVLLAVIIAIASVFKLTGPRPVATT